MKLNLNSKKQFFSRLLNSIANFIISLKPQHGFISEIIHPIPIEIQEKMKQYTWKSNCPVPLEDLSYLKLTYWGFDNKTHTNGELIIHKDKALEVIAIFKDLYEMEYPIDRMELIEKYQGDDESSMMMNNTSSFNCRLVTGSKDKWSYHSYGTAIDINPLLNPYVKDNVILPKNAVPFVDRTKFYPGKITKGDSVYKLFIKHGWIWGGDWKDRKDYQHFATME
ncbi:MAG TPA: M15 family metallopeptidase [Burkholderiales bacterium]|nr:M15 family metallopeptidase [Burkholderiales bacterium]